MFKKNLKIKICTLILAMVLLVTTPFMTVSAVGQYAGSIRNSSGTLLANTTMGCSTSGMNGSTSNANLSVVYYVTVQVQLMARSPLVGNLTWNNSVVSHSTKASDSLSLPSGNTAYAWITTHEARNSVPTVLGSGTLKDNW